MTRELMQQALDALNSGEDMQIGRVVWTEYDSSLVQEAITAIKEALAQPDNTANLYEELRSIIDGGSESFTHKDAVQYLKDNLAQPEQPVQPQRPTNCGTDVCSCIECLFDLPVAQPECSTHPDAPHGFSRNGSHNNGRYTCDCEGWTPQPATVNMSSIAQYKLDVLVRQGYAVNGYAIERRDGDLVSRGFVTEGGMVCWWHDDEPMGVVEVAQPEQEPVAYLCANAVGHKYFRWKKPSSTYKPIALYTSPPQRQPLTDDEIDDIWAGCSESSEDSIDMHEFARAIEAKLKEKKA